MQSQWLKCWWTITPKYTATNISISNQININLIKSSNSFNTFGHCQFAWLSFTVKHSTIESDNIVWSPLTLYGRCALCTFALNRHFTILHILLRYPMTFRFRLPIHFLHFSSLNTHFKAIDQKLSLIFHYYLHFSQKHTLLLILFHSPVRFRFNLFFLYFFLIGKLFL